MSTLALLPAPVEQHLGWILFSGILIAGAIIGATDLMRLSLKRIWAISGVCFAESIRRRVLLITPLAIIGVIIISQLQRPLDEQDVIRQTIKTALFATGLLVALSTIILACTNLPREIDNRVIFTVVTKPTTRLEIVLGKVIGFIRVSGVILIIMGVFTYGYLKVRSWSLQSDIATKLESKDTSPTSIATLTYYRDAGLLNAKTLEDSNEMQILARLPEAGDSRRYVYGNGEGSFLVPFDITTDIQQAIDPSQGGGTLGVLVNVGFIKHQEAAKTPPATKTATTEPTTRPYYGPFIMSPEERAAMMKGSQPQGLPFIAIELMDANQNSIGGAIPVGGAKLFDLDETNKIMMIPALIEQKVASKLNGRVYIHVTGMSDGEYFVDPKVAPPVAMRVATILNNQPVVRDIPQAKDLQNSTETAPILFQTRSVSAGQQLRGGDERTPVAIYSFRNTNFSAPADNEAPFELHVGVERSGADETKGDSAVQPTRVAIRVRNSATGQVSDETIIQPESNRTLLFTVPAQALSAGNFDVLMRCLTPGDFLGLQDKSLTLITSRQFFAWNLFKSLLILWLMSILVTAIAIFASTFLSWPIAVVLTIVMLLGHWGVEQLGDATAPGIGSQVVSDFGLRSAYKAEAVRATVEKLSSFLNFISTILPDISKFPAVEDIERGIAIPAVKLEEAVGVALGFGVPLALLAYLILKNKEVAP